MGRVYDDLETCLFEASPQIINWCGSAIFCKESGPNVIDVVFHAFKVG